MFLHIGICVARPSTRGATATTAAAAAAMFQLSQYVPN